MPISAVDVINPAFERMKRQLFPFRLGQWLRFALVGFLAGEMGQNGGCSVRLPLDVISERIQRNEFQSSIGAGTSALFVAGIVMLVLLALLVGVLFLYISSRMRFVLFDSIVQGECRIRNSWNRRGEPAFDYFLFQLVLSLIGLASLIVLVGFPALLAFGLGWFEDPSQHILGFVLGGIAVGSVFVTWIVVFTLIQVLTKDFVVPQMAVEGIPPTEGWRRLWPLMKAEKGGYAGYIGMKIVLSLLATVVLGIAAILVFLVFLIPVAILAAVGIIGGGAAGLTWNPVTIATAIVLGALALLVIFLIVSLISVPAVVFFPAYSIHFFADRYPGLHALLFPPAPEPDLSSPSPQL